MSAPKKSAKATKATATGKSSTSSATSSFGGGFWMRHWLPGLILAVLPFILYMESTSFGYVLDDKIVLSENKFVQKGTKGLGDIFGKESFTGFLGEQQDLVAGARYRPLSIATFAVEWEMFSKKGADGKTKVGNPGISHGLNIVLYALTALIIFRILMMLVPPKEEKQWWFSVPFVGALLFALHPTHVEAVANIKGRDEILALLLSLATLYGSLRYIATKQLLWAVTAPVLFLLACLAKENALTFLAVVPLALILLKKTPTKEAIMASLPLLGAGLLFIIIRTAVIGYLLDSGKEVTDLMNNPFVDAVGGQKSATITMTVGWYLKLLFVPHPLTHDYYPYHVPLVGWGDWRALLSLALVPGLIGLAVWQWKRAGVVAFSILYFFITLSMVSNVVFSVGTFMNERFLYMPSVGWCMVLAYLLADRLPALLKGGFGKWAGIGLVTVMAVGFAVRTYTRVPDWENAATLEESSIKVSVNSARSNQYYAYIIYEQALKEQQPAAKKALFDKAWPYVNRALEIYPAYSDAHICRDGIAAGYYQLDGDINKLLPYFENTLKTKPVEFVDQYLDYLVRRGFHQPEMLAFFHRIGYEYFWKQKHDAVNARKYLNMGLQMVPGEARMTADLAEVR